MRKVGARGDDRKGTGWGKRSSGKGTIFGRRWQTTEDVFSMRVTVWAGCCTATGGQAHSWACHLRRANHVAPSPCSSWLWPVRVAYDGGSSCLLLGTSLFKGLESELWPTGMRVTDHTNQALIIVRLNESNKEWGQKLTDPEEEGSTQKPEGSEHQKAEVRGQQSATRYHGELARSTAGSLWPTASCSAA